LPLLELLHRIDGLHLLVRQLAVDVVHNHLLQKRVLFSTFPHMFVPSLSWKVFDFFQADRQIAPKFPIF
jgi:hypothetical protein